MSSTQIERKLAAIMFTDIAGYTALSAKDENKALELLDTQKQIITPIVEEFNGTLHKEMGDGLLFTFPTVTEAVKCGIKIQEETKANDDLNLRVGIHEGEITLKDGDALGDDVNVASRIEAFAPSGGIAISSKVQQNISSLPEFETSYVGKPELKGVAQEVKVYCITSHGLPKADEIDEPIIVENKSKFNVFALTGSILTAIGVAFWIAVVVFDVSFGGKAEVPSVGILMMENLGSEDEEFWSSGMTADLITKVAGAGLIRVAPLDDILKLDKELSIGEKAKKLRVKYILTHSFLIKDDGFDLWCKLENIENGVALFSNKISEPMDMTTQMVGKLANDIITSLKVKTKQDVMKSPTDNAEAYEHYLRAKSIYKVYDTNNYNYEIVRSLLLKAIELDNQLFEAKLLLGETYMFLFGGNVDYEKPLEIFESALIEAENLSDKKWIGRFLNILGELYLLQSDYEKAIDYCNSALRISETINDKSIIGMSSQILAWIYTLLKDYDKAFKYNQRALNLREELNDKNLIAQSVSSLSQYYVRIKDYDTAEKYLKQALQLQKELGDKRQIAFANWRLCDYYIFVGDYENGIKYANIAYYLLVDMGESTRSAIMLGILGNIYNDIGDYNKAVGYYDRSLKILEEFGDKRWIGYSLGNIGNVYADKGDYKKAGEYLEKSLAIYKEIELGEGSVMLETTTYLYLNYKNLGKQYDEREIHTLIKETENIEFEINYRLYELLEDTSYLETAYNQVQELADNLEPDVAAKFLSYPIPKAIVEEWEKIK